MVHRKDTHSQANMFKCRDFKVGACRFDSKECWYSHDALPQDEAQSNLPNQDFQKAPENQHPPDMMERLITMMKKLSEKVNKLERSVHSDQ